MAPLVRTERYENSFFPYTIKAWKELNDEAKSKPSVQSFKKILIILFDLLGTPFMGYVINLVSNYLLKLELVFQTYATTDLTIISTVKVLYARAVLKTKHLFISSYAVRIINLNA